MAELRGIKWSLFLMLLLQFTAVTGQQLLSLIVRAGADVTLPCESLKDDMNNCESTTWLSSDSKRSGSVDLVTGGRITEAARDKSDRLRFSENCSLVIKSITEEDADGLYFCRQDRSGQFQDSGVYLAVVKLTEHYDINDDVTFRCFVTKRQRCRHKVKWLFQGQAVGKDNPDLRPSQSECYASVTFPVNHFSYTSRYNLFKCEVTDGNNVQKFSFSSPQSSGEVTQDYTDEVKLFAFSPQPAGDETITTGTNEHQQLENVWRWITVSVGLAALITSVVAINIWIRKKEKKTQMDELTVHYDVDDDTVNYENI